MFADGATTGPPKARRISRATGWAGSRIATVSSPAVARSATAQFGVFGSTIVMRLIGRFPAIITLGAALLGWVAGDMLDSDPILVGWIAAHMPWLQFTLPLIGEISWSQIAGAVLVVAVGRVLAARAVRIAAKPIDLAAGVRQSRSN